MGERRKEGERGKKGERRRRVRKIEEENRRGWHGEDRERK